VEYVEYLESASPEYEVLTEFFEDDLITEVIRVVKSGKEGTVYCCRAAERTGEELLAAKVYRPPEHRLFHNSAVYQEGRWMPDKRLRRAMANKSRAGRSVQADTWVGHEYRTLRMLHDAGAAVPRPFARSGQALLMSYVGDLDAPAPLLQHADIRPADAEPLFRRLLQEIELWLSCGRVHADLSAFNILYWDDQPTVIDFPQAVDPEENMNARELLTRDIANLCRFFARFGIRADAETLASGLWRQIRWREW
jgi:RIO kinase 1